jgi:hypothetical protein
MRSILKILFTLLVLAISTAIVGLFLPTQYKFVQTKDLSVPPLIIFEQLSNFRNWDNWAPWQQTDSAMLVEYGEITKGRMAVMNWQSKVFGPCQLTITQAVVSENVAVNFDFSSDIKSSTLWYIDSTVSGCKLNWTSVISNLSYFERYFALFYKKQMNKLIQSGLANLSELSIELKYSRTGDINIVDVPTTHAVIMLDSIRHEDIEERIKYIDDYLLRFFERRELKTTGRPFKFVYGMANDSLDKFALGYALPERTWVWQTLSYMRIPEGKALSIQYFGRPEKSNKAHNKLREYMLEKNYHQNGIPWEVRLFNPETDLDTSMWETVVYIPINNEAGRP